MDNMNLSQLSLALASAVHPKAMPVMLDSADYGRWLDNDHADACQLATPFPDARMRLISGDYQSIISG